MASGFASFALESIQIPTYRWSQTPCGQHPIRHYRSTLLLSSLMLSSRCQVKIGHN